MIFAFLVELSQHLRLKTYNQLYSKLLVNPLLSLRSFRHCSSALFSHLAPETFPRSGKLSQIFTLQVPETVSMIFPAKITLHVHVDASRSSASA